MSAHGHYKLPAMTAALPPERGKVFADLALAMVEPGEVVTFRYPKSGVGPAIPRTFSPWEWDGGAETMIGWDHGADSIRQYKIARIIGMIGHDESIPYRPPS